MSNWGSYIKI